MPLHFMLLTNSYCHLPPLAKLLCSLLPCRLVLFVVTMRRQLKHMLKYRYLPFSWGKKVGVGQVHAPLAVLEGSVWQSYAHHAFWCRKRMAFICVPVIKLA
jgi:hypothetical protein